MVVTNFRNCKIQILRKGEDYGINKKNISSIAHFFIPWHENFHLSIGCSQEDDIQIPNLMTEHVSFLFAGEDLQIQNQGAITLTLTEFQRSIPEGQRLKLNLVSPNYHFKITFPEQTQIIAKIQGEQEKLPPETLQFLESKYGPLKKIAEGKSSLLYQIKHNRVLKILRPSYTKNKGVITRFLSAARKFQAISNPLFLKIHQIVALNRRSLYFVVMEHFQGETLENYLAKRGVLSFQEAKEIIRAIAENLLSLQEQNYSCRNLTPSNVLINNNHEARITGFFLLKSDINLTALGAQMVIPRYTAPEQARDPSASDIFSDMFSLGAIFHALVTGEPPFNTANVGQYMRLLNMQRTVEAEEIEEVSNLSPEKARIIASLLAYDKKERPSPAKLLEMLSPQEETLSFNFEDEEDEEEENEESMFLEIEPGSSSEPEVEHSDFLNEDTQQLEVVAESEEELLKEDNDDSVFSALEFLDEDALEADEEEDNLGKTQQAVAVSDESLGIFQEDTLDLERENKNRKPPKQTHKPKSVEEATLEFLDETEED